MQFEVEGRDFLGEACRRPRFQRSSIQAAIAIFARFLDTQTRRKHNAVFNIVKDDSAAALSERTIALAPVGGL